MYASIASPRHPDPRTITIARSKRLNRHHGLQTRLRECPVARGYEEAAGSQRSSVTPESDVLAWVTYAAVSRLVRRPVGGLVVRVGQGRVVGRVEARGEAVDGAA